MNHQLDYMTNVMNAELEWIFQLGHARAGTNGPHGHRDTPARNSAHYLVISSFLSEATGDSKYRRAANVLIDYLCRLCDTSESGAVQCMDGVGFDRINGLIGQAWVIEGLAYAGKRLGCERALDYAMRVALVQKYDFDLHLWTRIDVNRSGLGIDPTYNHHVWFAAATSDLLKVRMNAELHQAIADFLEVGTRRDFRVYGDGLLKHSVSVAASQSLERRTKRLAKVVLQPVRGLNRKKLDYRYMEQGYHLFDMYGFSILEEAFPDIDFFHTSEYTAAFSRAMDVDQANCEMGVFSFLDGRSSEINVYGFPYNNPAFEFPFVATAHGLDCNAQIEWLIALQDRLMLEGSSGMRSVRNPDVLTWNARSYELVRYFDTVSD